MKKNANRSAARAAIRLLAATALLGAATAAQAALVTTTNYTITGTNFDGTFTLANNGGAYSLTAFSATYLGYQFNLGNTELLQQSTSIIIGGSLYGAKTVAANTNDFYTGFFVPSDTSPVIRGGSAITATTQLASFNYTITPIVAAPVAGAVPEPATWAMMIAGFGAVGVMMRRRATVTKMAFA